MLRNPIRSCLYGLLPGLMLAACGPVPESSEPMEPEVLGVTGSALCSNSAVTSLTLSGVSTYAGEMAGAGTYAVSYPANAAFVAFYIDGAEASSGRATGGATGTWSFSKSPVTCGTHTFKVTAWPMVVSSDGSWSACTGNPSMTITRSVSEPCPGKCEINGRTYSNGQLNPSSGCQICDVTQSQTSWSFYSAGYANKNGYCKSLVSGGAVCAGTSSKVGEPCTVSSDCWLTCGELL
ncbi:MAG TPA: hypothetical protein VEU33_51430 [Archangium sp.]|nr:hypothetical protein [Archangium sp.]